MRAILLLALLLPALPAPAAAQTQFLYDFEVQAVPSQVSEVPFAGGAGQLTVNFTLADNSHDSPTGYVGGTPQQGLLLHQVNVRTQAFPTPKQGWDAAPLDPSFSITAGQTHSIPIRVSVYSSATDPFYRILVNLTITTQDGLVFQRIADMSFFTKGFPGFALTDYGPYVSLGQREISNQTVTVWNRASLQRAFEFQVGYNPCGILVVPPGTTTLLGYEQKTLTFQVVGPDDHFYYQGDSCTYQLIVSAQDNPGLSQSASLPLRLSGFYVGPQYIFWTAAAAALLVLLALAIHRRKQKLEEEILGKPQKPWLIPVERVYLERLRRKDPRAWYVVRHYLMEDEYRSSLLWYQAYKAATKGDRSKERLVLKQERAYESWKAAWKKRIAKPMAKADAYEARLQRKLDRKARRDLRKRRARWRKLVRNLKAAHRKALRRAAERQAKMARQAARKGLAQPAALAVPAVEIPPEPTAQPKRLAEHRWARRAARFRVRMRRREGNLEVRYERADARYQQRLRRRVARVARKLDDPSFAAEHPLLRHAD